MKKQLLILCFVFAVGMTLFQSCKKEESADPPKAGIFYSVDVRQVAFTALTKRAETFDWDFGDGQSSSEKNPFHVYAAGGYYKVYLTVTDAIGRTALDSATLAIDLTPYVLLTGGPTAVNGKTWKLTANHPAKDRLAMSDAVYSLADPDIPALPQGAFGLFLGIGEVYDDEYTFYFNGDYAHDTKADNAAFAGYVNQLLTNGGTGIVSVGPGGAAAEFGLCTALYTPQTDATFTYVENEDFAVPSVWGAGGVVTYNDVSTLDFSGTEFVGFMDNQRKVIVQEITDNTMRLVMFMAASPTYFPLNTNALILTFQVVN